MSQEHLLDTLLHQNPDGITYSFTVPECDCRPHWIKISNTHYWYDVDFDSFSNGYIKKGKKTFKALLKPATAIALTLERDRTNTFADTAFLYITDVNNAFSNRDALAWHNTFSYEDFQDIDANDGTIHSAYTITETATKRKISKYFRLPSGSTFKLKWFHKENISLDTHYAKFKAEPFDTVQLQYTFPNK